VGVAGPESVSGRVRLAGGSGHGESSSVRGLLGIGVLGIAGLSDVDLRGLSSRSVGEWVDVLSLSTMIDERRYAAWRQSKGNSVDKSEGA
jgi:hypothetical protein